MANLFSDQNLGYALEIILTNEIRSPHQTQVTGANVTAYYRAHPQLSNLLTVATPKEKRASKVHKQRHCCDRRSFR